MTPDETSEAPETSTPKPAAEPAKARQGTRAREKKKASTQARKPARKQVKPKAKPRKIVEKGVPQGPVPVDSPAKEEVIAACFDLYVIKKMSYGAIAKAVGIDRHTVGQYVALEGARRRQEMSEARQGMIARNLDTIDRVETYYLDRMESADRKGDEGRYVLEAAKQRTALMGLDEGIVIKDERKDVNRFSGLSPEAALEILKNAPTGGAFGKPGGS